MTQAESAAPGWFQDPTGRFAQRYWDGTTWTAAVCGPAGGAPQHDPTEVPSSLPPPPPPAPPAPAPSPGAREPAPPPSQPAPTANAGPGTPPRGLRATVLDRRVLFGAGVAVAVLVIGGAVALVLGAFSDRRASSDAATPHCPYLRATEALPWTGPPATAFRSSVEHEPNICSATSRGVSYFLSYVPPGPVADAYAQTFAILRAGQLPPGQPSGQVTPTALGPLPAVEVRDVTGGPPESWHAEVVVQQANRYFTVAVFGTPPSPQPATATLLAVAQVLVSSTS